MATTVDPVTNHLAKKSCWWQNEKNIFKVKFYKKFNKSFQKKNPRLKVEWHLLQDDLQN